MKICLAQTESNPGNIPKNLEKHRQVVAKAIAHHSDLVIFPELSLTGYEPSLAESLAIGLNDPRLVNFQTQADAGNITLCVGVPTQQTSLPGISLVIFQPHQPRQLYTKQFLHVDEIPFFTAGPKAAGLLEPQNEVALAICYELSVEDHAKTAAINGAKIYLASVAKSARGMAAANGRLAQIAKTYQMITLIVNCVGFADGGMCAGGTAVWDQAGQCLAQLDDHSEGLLLFDTIAKTTSCLTV